MKCEIEKLEEIIVHYRGRKLDREYKCNHRLKVRETGRFVNISCDEIIGEDKDKKPIMCCPSGIDFTKEEYENGVKKYLNIK